MTLGLAQINEWHWSDWY